MTFLTKILRRQKTVDLASFDYPAPIGPTIYSINYLTESAPMFHLQLQEGSRRKAPWVEESKSLSSGLGGTPEGVP